jgi:hypothetical protein
MSTPEIKVSAAYQRVHRKARKVQKELEDTRQQREVQGMKPALFVPPAEVAKMPNGRDKNEQFDGERQRVVDELVV